MSALGHKRTWRLRPSTVQRGDRRFAFRLIFRLPNFAYRKTLSRLANFSAPEEIKGADGQVRLSSIYERAAAE